MKEKIKTTAAIREASEEIGHSIPDSDLQFMKTYHWKRLNEDVEFEVFKYKISQENVDIKLDRSENTEFMWAKPKVLFHRKDLMAGLYPILEDEYEL
jgi:8-oxo-dGTP pyrophosphatase MutT (NUDIX family)